MFEVGIECAAGEIGAPAIVEVHRQEGDFAHGVDPAQVLAEFETVKEQHAFIVPYHVGEVGVAVAFAYEAPVFTITEIFFEFSEGQFTPDFQASQLGLVLLFNTWTDLFEVLAHRFVDAPGRPERLVISGDRDPAVKPGQLLRQQVDVYRLQFVAREHSIEPRLLGKLDHLDGVFDGRAGTVEPGGSGRAGDGNHAEVERFRQAPVQTQLLLAIEAAFVERAEIEKPEIDRFLDFVGVRAGEDDPGNMRFDRVNVPHRMVVAGGIEQRLNQGRKSVIHGMASLHEPAEGARPRRRLPTITEAVAEADGEFLRREAVILGAMMRDLDGTDERGDAAGGFPVHAAPQAIEQAGAIGVTATGRVGDLGNRYHRDFDHAPVGINAGAARAERDDQSLHVSCQFAQGFLGAFLHKFGFVIVERDPGGLLEEGQQIVAVEQRHALSRVEDEGNAGLGELPRMLDHALAPVGRNDAELDAVGVLHAILVRAVHGAGMKRGDLIVVHVGGDEGLSRVGVFAYLDMATVDAVPVD